MKFRVAEYRDLFVGESAFDAIRIIPESVVVIIMMEIIARRLDVLVRSGCITLTRKVCIGGGKVFGACRRKMPVVESIEIALLFAKSFLPIRPK